MCQKETAFFDHRYYRINKFLLCCHGQWPYQNKKQQFVLIVITCFGSFSVLPAQFAECFINRSDWSIMIPSFAPIIIHVGCMVKLFNSLIYRDRVKALLQRMKSDWNSPMGSERAVLEQYAEEGRLITTMYSVALGGSLVIFLLMSALPRFLVTQGWVNLSSTLLYPIPVHYTSADEEHYRYLQPYLLCVIFCVCSIVIAEDSIFVVFIQHACGIYSMVGYRIENLIESDDLDVDIRPSRKADKAFWIVIDCIKKHNEAIEFVMLLDSVYSSSFLILLGLNTMSISFTALQMVLGASPDSIDELMRQLLCTATQIIHLFFENYFCQRLTDHTLLVFEAIKKSMWYKTSLRTRQLLNFMLMKSMIPWGMKAGKIVPLSMESFSAILRTSMSYLTILRSME